MSFLDTLWKRDAFHRQLLQIADKHPTAEMQGKSECCRSGVCCWRRPGCLEPADVPKIAAHLGLTENELFRQRLVVDEIGGVTCLVPARQHQVGEFTGRMLPNDETFSIKSPCTFLGPDNSCTIHEVKPHDCREFKCWTGQYPEPCQFPEDQLKQLGWDGFDSDAYYDD